MAKKLSHKEVRRRMKMNELLEAEHWLVSMWKQHGKWISWGLIVLFIIVAGVYLYAQSRETKLADSMKIYGDALSTAGGETPEEALPLLNEVIEEYSTTPTYPFALLLKGSILENQGETENALETYRKVVDSGNKKLVPAGILGVATCQESLERPEEAEENYRNILEKYPETPFAGEARFMLARLLERQERFDEAIETYSAISEDSPWFDSAEERLEWLKAPVITLAEAQ